MILECLSNIIILLEEIMKIYLTEDKEHAQRIKKALKENDGYCPCSLCRNEDTKCMCREFREQNYEGYCHCGLYYKAHE